MSGKGLGRGFESLIPTELIDEEFDPTVKEDEKVSKLRELPVGDVVRDEGQPRREFRAEALEMLAASIREHGVLQPIVVVREGSKYKIVAGERRWRASKIAGLSTVPAIVRTLDDQNRLELAIIENVQREDLNAIETATAYAKLKTQFNLSVAEIAAKVGKSEAAIINTMRLLNLPEEAKRAMVEHGLSEGVMRPLITASSEVALRVVPKIIEEGWSARRVEQYIATMRQEGRVSLSGGSRGVKREEEARKLEERVGGKVAVNMSARGSGQIVIKFRTERELREILGKIGAGGV
jgi:ParB family chromosome partitioning protein